jgi:hypothetical protein
MCLHTAAAAAAAVMHSMSVTVSFELVQQLLVRVLQALQSQYASSSIIISRGELIYNYTRTASSSALVCRSHPLVRPDAAPPSYSLSQQVHCL